MTAKATSRRSEGSFNPKTKLWQVRATIGGRRRAFYGHTLTEAKRKAASEAGAWTPISRDTLGAFIDEWLAAQKRALKPQTWRRYEQLTRLHVVPHIGHLQLAAVNERDVDALQETLEKGHGRQPLGATTRRHVHVVLGTAMEAARKRGLISVNPVRHVDAPKTQKKTIHPLTPEQARKLLATARGTKFEAVWTLALNTGMRSGEIMALRWSDIDGSLITIRGSAITGPQGRSIDSTKTDSGGRTITLNDLTLNALRVHRERHPSTDLIFPSSDGGVMAAGTLLRQGLRPLLKQAGLRADTTVHDLRHSFATLALNANVPIHVVSAVMGHASPTITLNIYTHYVVGNDAAASTTMAGLLG
jgi:integrase